MRKGFTLIELLVVLGILGILAAALLATINPVAQLQKSNDARRKSDLEAVQRALELYYQDTGSYPASSLNTFYIAPGGTAILWDNPWPPYIKKLPKDPIAAHTYVYYSTGQAYYLYANLERKTDPQACNSGNACGTLTGAGGFPTATACGGVPCNYGVTSPNVSP